MKNVVGWRKWARERSNLNFGFWVFIKLMIFCALLYRFINKINYFKIKTHINECITLFYFYLNKIISSNLTYAIDYMNFRNENLSEPIRIYQIIIITEVKLPGNFLWVFFASHSNTSRVFSVVPSPLTQTQSEIWGIPSLSLKLIGRFNLVVPLLYTKMHRNFFREFLPYHADLMTGFWVSRFLTQLIESFFQRYRIILSLALTRQFLLK